MLAQFKLAGAAELLNQLVPSTEPAQVSESSLSDVATVMHARLHAELAVMTARADAARSAQVVSGSGRQAEEFPPLLATTVATACTLHETDPLPPLPPTGASPSRLVQLAKLYAAFVVSNLLPPLECLLVLLAVGAAGGCCRWGRRQWNRAASIAGRSTSLAAIDDRDCCCAAVGCWDAIVRTAALMDCSRMQPVHALCLDGACSVALSIAA